MADVQTFTLTEGHLALLAATSFMQPPGGRSAPFVDAKRPYGFSGRGTVGCCAAEIMGWEPEDVEDGRPVFSDDQIEAALAVHDELAQALNVICSARCMVPGFYVGGTFLTDAGWRSQWVRLDDDDADIADLAAVVQR